MKLPSFETRKYDAFVIVTLESLGTFLISITLTKYLTPADRGIYSTIIASIFLISFLGGNVHSRAIYFRTKSQDRNYSHLLLSSLILSTGIISIVGTLICSNLQRFSNGKLLIIFLGSIGLSIFNFLVSYLSSLENHKRLLKFSFLVFLFHLLTVLVIIKSREPLLALLSWLATIWLAILLIVVANLVSEGRNIFLLPIPNMDFIKRNILPRLASLPIYLSIFDSLKIDVLLCTFFLGYEITGNYVLVTTLSVSLQFLYRLFFLKSSRWNNSLKRPRGEDRFSKVLISFLLIGAIGGIILSSFVSNIISTVFPLGYSVNRFDFLLIWWGNLMFWGRRLVGDLMIWKNFDKFIGISEFVGAFTFCLILIAIKPENLREFSIGYCLSLFVAFLFILFVRVLVIRKSYNLGNLKS